MVSSTMQDLMSVREAAARLGVHRSRVHALIRAGRLHGRKVGGRWLVDRSSLDQWVRSRLLDGRPFSPRRAWGYLFLLSGEPAAWLDRATRSRLRKTVREVRLNDLLPKLRNRGDVQYFRGAPEMFEKIRAQPGFVRSGVSTSEDLDANLLVRDALEGYLPRARVREAAYRLALEPSDAANANVILRIPSFAAPLRDRVMAPAGAVAADLIESADARTSRAGDMLAERLRADRARSG